MSEKILGLEDVCREDVAIAGGKGANLGENGAKRFPRATGLHCAGIGLPGVLRPHWILR